MTSMAFTTIKLEGILDLSNIEDLNEEDLGNTFTKMCCPPPTVSAGIRVLVLGINLSVKFQKRLIIASRAARH